MYSYALLENGCHYLIQEKEDSPITLIQVTVESDHCLYIAVNERCQRDDSQHTYHNQ